ncbi:MAG: DUF1634 domain-containing protein [Tepidisphaeraceae bacterium]|jgi:uncharacterized membrane protein
MSVVDSQTPPQRHPLPIEDASAWILRGGVICSAAVMLMGIIFSFVHGRTSLDRMKSDGFDYRPAVIWQGILRGHGKSIIEAGIYLLLLTPILRVAASAVLFALEERDWLYTIITLTVLLLTLAGLLWLG